MRIPPEIQNDTIGWIAFMLSLGWGLLLAPYVIAAPLLPVVVAVDLWKRRGEPDMDWGWTVALILALVIVVGLAGFFWWAWIATFGR